MIEQEQIDDMNLNYHLIENYGDDEEVGLINEGVTESDLFELNMIRERIERLISEFMNNLSSGLREELEQSEDGKGILSDVIELVMNTLEKVKGTPLWENGRFQKYFIGGACYV
ncbi:MAG: hypothetical protein EZS28_032599 [Streblomastix strix]|uniref:Uncharacterized protein n=1 Tax=Streblomastix strix TaxID=222440 RepID=A0A5J4UNX5_9EUKA|nr:MAG: hypothetical protein EZS28_032599 [Streblomastix strix]